MGSVNVRKETGKLVIEFRLRGKRCREHTALADSKANRKQLEKLLERIELEIQQGTFDYAKYFPNSKMVAKLGTVLSTIPAPVATSVAQAYGPVAGAASGQSPPVLPTFGDFTKVWVAENEISWRRSHKKTVMDILNKHVLPVFKDMGVGHITKSEILAFRSTLAKVPGRKADTLSAKRINAIMAPLRQIINEAADRYEFNTPYRKIKMLKQPRIDVEPFTMAEVKDILAKVRPDFKDYYTVRFFTGMRTGEIDGLKWKYVDFEHRLILVRETIVAGMEDITKTDESQRDIQMSEVVYQALMAQAKVTQGKSDFVFCNQGGKPFDHNNITKRVWYPLLRHLGLKLRRPYQTRHTAATLWLASGENPLWIAKQLGHVSTAMLFKVYGRFVPDLTHRDGSAFERLLVQSGAVEPALPLSTFGLLAESDAPVTEKESTHE